MEIRTSADLQMLIDSEIVESTTLEYKAAPAIDNKDEIGKDVSAMANASGGTIIYGMAEIDNKPHHVEPITNAKRTREYLDQVINDQIRPKVKCVIHPIEANGGMVYVVEIPQGETAHQSKFDGRYHRRRNVTISWMEDYEIRDIMNRSKLPKVVVRFAITGGAIHAWLFNEADTIAIHIRCVLRLTGFILRDQNRGVEELHRDFKELGVLHGKADDIPLGDFFLSNQAQHDLYYGFNENKVLDAPIHWKVWADNSVNEGTIRIREIKVTDLNTYMH